MNTEWRSDEVVQTAARNLFMGSAPERSEELRSLWETYQPQFNVLSDISEGEKVILDAGAYRLIRFNHRIMRAFWVSSFAAWEAYSVIAISIQTGTPPNFDRLIEIINCVGQILGSDDPEIIPLPSGIPDPGTLVDANKNSELRAAGELAILSIGWVLLHEIKHIQHQQDGSSASIDAPSEDCHSEELSCDAYATSFLLEKVQKYSEEQGVSAALVRQKRQVGIYFALFAMTLISKDQWGASETHPSLEERINRVSRYCQGSGSEVAGVIAFLAFHSLKQLWPNAPGLNSK